MKHKYTKEFYAYVEGSSGPSAQKVIPVLYSLYPAASVLDIGCGRGSWLAAWRDAGIEDVHGVDGDLVEPLEFLKAEGRFTPADLARQFNLGRKFGVVTCLEVGEHIDKSHAETLVENIVRHGDVVYFSAAVPGQGGAFHVNEQPLEYWIDLFGHCGFSAYDAIRPLLVGIPGVEPWYRYNMLLFANDSVSVQLSDSVLLTRIPQGVAPEVIAPLYWRIRCLCLRILPAGIINWLANIKHKFAAFHNI